ncbi:cobalamin biosynthesis protein [Halocatena pleomorpha]|uniref:Cobalamin biosynthesis protein n=1 Tax=Halocatena pleomorpha TaxID=1785090 RepID=A0A3P3RLH8_9EURY|nr:cobalamin biosynthesis protein [Halocatena pleomorpha]RRJ33710.1 cobalamin biosynthesis protein [Halocatena pleomorpha]
MRETGDDLLDPTPETAYFWGRVAGNGTVTTDRVIVRVGDKSALDAVAGTSEADANGEDPKHTIAVHESAHDATVVRYEEVYELRIPVSPSFAQRATDAGVVTGADVPENRRFTGFDDHRQQLVRGLLEACGTVCFQESSASVGVSFVHEDKQLLEALRTLLGNAAPEIPTEGLSESSSGGYWFGLAATADPAAFARWVYAGSDDSGLYAADRRRKLRRSVERATGGDVGSLSFSE